MDQSNPRAYSNLANVFASQGLNELALKNYDHALRLDSNYVDAIKNRGIVRAELKQYEGALADFGKVLELQPSYWRAHIYIATGKLLKALHEYDLAQIVQLFVITWGQFYARWDATSLLY